MTTLREKAKEFARKEWNRLSVTERLVRDPTSFASHLQQWHIRFPVEPDEDLQQVVLGWLQEFQREDIAAVRQVTTVIRIENLVVDCYGCRGTGKANPDDPDPDAILTLPCERCHGLGLVATPAGAVIQAFMGFADMASAFRRSMDAMTAKEREENRAAVKARLADAEKSLCPELAGAASK